MRRIDTPATAKGHTRKTDRALICDNMTELAERMAKGISDRSWGDGWLGGLSRADADKFLRQGDESRVAASDAFLAKLEDQFEFHTGRFRTIDAISGGCPNVAAYLAGAPLAMRRRQRVLDDVAPLTIVVDTTSSGGIGADKLEKRGAAILALVRILSARRPVTLYAGVAMGNKQHANTDGMNVLLTRIETAPLDLARAAFLIAHPGAARGIGYGIVVDEFDGSRFSIPWPFDDVKVSRAYGPEYYGRLFPGSEILAIPPVFASDAAINTPETWIGENVAKYGGIENQAAA